MPGRVMFLIFYDRLKTLKEIIFGSDPYNPQGVFTSGFVQKFNKGDYVLLKKDVLSSAL